MKFSLLQENLNAALQNVSRFTSFKAQLPILSNILFSTDQGRLKLTATNLDLGINCWLGAKVDIEGTFAIPAREIVEFVSYLSPGRLDVSLNSQSLLEVSAANAQSSFTTISPNDFPTLPSLNSKTAIELDLPLLSASIAQVAFAAATDDSRPVLTAVLCSFTQDNLSLVATDGFRLSVKSIKLVNPITLPDNQENLTLLIPARSLSEVVKLSKNLSKIKLGTSSDANQLVFVLEDLEIVSRLIDGEFPDFKRIMPPSFTTKVTLGKEDLMQGIRIASVFAKESANVVKIFLKKSALEISANAPQVGRNKATVEAKIEGQPLEIAFNYKFISDFINICQGNEVVIELNENLTPASFHDQSDPAFTHIIMPVRIQD